MQDQFLYDSASLLMSADENQGYDETLFLALDKLVRSAKPVDWTVLCPQQHEKLMESRRYLTPPDWRLQWKEYLLSFAVKAGCLRTVQRLMELGADITFPVWNLNELMQDTYSAVSVAIAYDQGPTVKFLIEQLPSPIAPTLLASFLYQAIHHANIKKQTSKDNLSILRYLFERGADPHSVLPQTASKLRAYEYALQRKALDAAVICFEVKPPAELRFKKKHVLQYVAPGLTLAAAKNIVMADVPFTIKCTSMMSDAGFENVHVLEEAPHHEFTWTTLLDCSLQLPLSLRGAVVKAVLDETDFALVDRKERYSRFSLVKDAEGRQSLSITDKATRHAFYDELMLCGRYELDAGPPLHKSSSSVIILATDYQLYPQLFGMYATPQGLDVDGFTKANDHLCYLQPSDTASHATAMFELFQRWDKDHSGELCESEWLRYCSHTFGEKFKVALKLLKRPADYVREMAARRKELSVACVMPLLPTESVEETASALKAYGLVEYSRMLVMPHAARSLYDIFLKERPSHAEIRHAMEQIVSALQNLHSSGIVHGDVKMRKVLRLGKRFRLTDLEAASATGDHALGAKFTTGTLPPECYVRLPTTALDGHATMEAAKAHKRYWCTVWKSETNADEIRGHLTKILPSADLVVVRAFCGDVDMTALPSLPYERVKATPALDLWALGCMLFKLCSTDQSSLLDGNCDEDIATSQYKQALEWTDVDIARRIAAKVVDANARDLIGHLLQVDPTKRLPLDQVLLHAYFKKDSNSAAGGVAESAPTVTMEDLVAKIDMSFNNIMTRVDLVATTVTDEIQKSTAAILAELHLSTTAIAQAVYDASEVKVPTSFILLPVKRGVAHHAEGTTDTILKFIKTISKISKADKPLSWSTAWDCVRGQVDAFAGLKNLLCMQETLYLYLIDDVTGEIAMGEGSIYPLEVTKKTTDYYTFVDKYMPLIQGSFALVDGVDKIARLLGLVGVPKVTGTVVREMKSAIATMEATVTDVVEAATANKSVTGVRGASLRQLDDFFAQHDPQRNFAGLSRVHINGVTQWTVFKDEAREETKACLV
ncbi:hypothetical protein ACHHYP_05097 [Achlya hypogyna]|uniref:Calmodulin n=1 Tax=Achlya hypogyna TaxID=1202772 RepID=A0A1V9YZ43_ACHHY|nr:hypothetical protein ACHHYP_05097 [Achlya hypogyna]